MAGKEQVKGTCDRCGKAVGFTAIDYCAWCATDLCPDCMAAGCCGVVPAVSGLQADYGVDEDDDFEEYI